MCEIEPCKINSDLPEIIVSDVERRMFLAGTASLPLAAILADTSLAQAQAGKLEKVTTKLANGSTAHGYLAKPKNGDKAPAIILIHEWWGLNDQIKSVAQEFADKGYMALAVDLFGGSVATTREQALAQIKALESPIAVETMKNWVSYMRKRGNGKVGTIGWCFGGGWSLNTSIATPVDATVIYYGRVTAKAANLMQLQGPILGHFGTLDKSINKEMVDGFLSEAKKAGIAKDITVHWYQANHGFANPTTTRFDEQDTQLAWQRTIDFFAKNL